MYIGYIVAGVGVFLFVLNTILTAISSKKLKQEDDQLQKVFESEYYK